jgi:hypothetical protein
VQHVIPDEQLTAASIRRHFMAYGRSLVRRSDIERTWILGYPRSVCRGYCLLTRTQVLLRRIVGRTNWVPLLARCATWEGMLDEARANARLPQKELAEVVDD